MKKILFIALLSTIVITVQAQFGLKGGVNFASIHGNDVSDAKGLTGFYFGPYYNISIANNFSVQTEAVYSAEGAKESGTDAKLHLNYVNISALLRYNCHCGFFVGTGPQYGFLTSAKLKQGGTTQDEKDLFKSGDFSWGLAAGYDMHCGFGFYTRYNLGLGSIAKDQFDTKQDVKTSCFQVGFRYNFTMEQKKK
jgi:hypothetical protein